MFELLRELVNIQSPSGAEQEIALYLSDILSLKKYRIERQQLDSDRFNIIAFAGGQPRLLFCTHMDTVSPFMAFREAGELIYGRGVCDAKGALVSMIQAGDRLKKDGLVDFALLFVVGEEYNSDGAKKAAEMRLNSRYVILGEPTENQLAAAQKGTLVFKIISEGRAAHSGYPDLGDSAVDRLLSKLESWRTTDWGEDPVIGQTTLNIGKIDGGSGVNVIADYAEAEGIFRIATSVQRVKTQMGPLQEKNLRVNVISSSEPQHLVLLPGIPTTTVSFGSDAAYLQPLGKMYMLGPGSIKYAHSKEEQILKNELERAVELYVAMARHLIGENKNK